MYFTYVLYSQKFDKIYVGFTSELTQRLQSHNDSRNTGWTFRYQPWELLYMEEHLLKADAMMREKRLKSFKGSACIREIVTMKDHLD